MDKILLVTFYDIQIKRDWRVSVDDINPILSYAVGFEVEGKEGYMYLAALATEEGDLAEITIIPKGCIKDIKVLQEI